MVISFRRVGSSFYDIAAREIGADREPAAGSLGLTGRQNA